MFSIGRTKMKLTTVNRTMLRMSWMTLDRIWWLNLMPNIVGSKNCLLHKKMNFAFMS